METANKNSIKKKWIRRFVIAGIILLLFTAGRLVLKSDWLFDIAKDIAEEQFNNRINGSVRIDLIRGDLLNGFTISGVQLRGQDEQEVATVDTISVSYELFSLIRSPYAVKELSVIGVNAFAEQGEDSVWNVMKLLPEMEAAEEESDPLYWSIEQFRLNRVNINIQSDYLLPDSSLTVEGLRAEATAGSGSNGYYGTLQTLEFAIDEQRLPEPIDVIVSAEGSGNRFTLESLIINTGRSYLNANAAYASENEVRARADAAPVSWLDLAAYLDGLPLQQNVEMELGAEGSLSDLTLSLRSEAPGMEALNASINMEFSERISVKNIQVEIEQLNLPTLTGMDDAPYFEMISFTGRGDLFADSPQDSDWSGELAINGFRFEDYRLDQFTSTYSLREGNADFSGVAAYGDEQVDLTAAIRDAWSDSPEWQGTITSTRLNMATWLQDSAMESSLNIRADFSGDSFDPDQFTAQAAVNVSDSRYGNQPFSEFRFEGELNSSAINGFITGRLDESTVTVDLSAENWQTTPNYEFQAGMQRFNIAEITGFESFPTYINGTLTGSGTSFKLENINLNAAAALDSSIVNGEEIETMNADFQLQNQILEIENAVVESPIIDAGFSLRQHIIDLTDIDNRFDFSATLKDLHALAPLFGVEFLESEGTITGGISRNSESILEFNGDADLQNIQADSLFLAGRVTGTISALITEEPEVTAQFELFDPKVQGMEVQNVQILSRAILKKNEATGEIELDIVNDENQSLSHKGTFRVDTTTVRLHTTEIDFITDLRRLSLSEPFDAEFQNNTLRVDTLTVQNDNQEAYLKMWVLHADTLKQHAGMDAKNLNLGALQSLFIDEQLFDGYLSGSINLLNSADTLDVESSVLISDLQFQNGTMDTLQFSMQVRDEWLDAGFYGNHNSEELFRGETRVPFLPGDPLTFDEQFFDRSINGRFELFASDLKYWLSFIPDNNFEQTEGTISFTSVLSGEAGSPELEGNLDIRQGLFSGIAVDSIWIDMLYLHEEENIVLNGGMISQQQPILDFDVSLPFLVDLKRAEILLPSDSDAVYGKVSTNQFDLALFNNYVDRELLRNLRGRLNGEVTVAGPLGDLETVGRMELNNGSMRVVPAGITLDEMGFQVNFRPDLIELQQLHIQSSPGRLRGSGYVTLDNLEPGELNFTMRTTQFRAANTSEYNAIVDLDSKVEGTMDQPRISGSLSFLRGFVNLQNFGERSVEDVQLEGEEEVVTIAYYDSLAIDMDVNFDRQFFIRNQQFLDMEIELAGQVDLLKDQGSELQMFGSLEGVRGYARPLGKNFMLDQAVVTFFGPVDNPELNVRTQYEPQQAQADVRIFYIIEGTAQEPEFRFESEPELELQDIISYTLFGKPFYELESWEQTVAGSGSSPSATDLAVDVLLDRVETIASRRLGIDVVEIDNSRSGSNSTTSIKTGWYLNRRTFFAILNEISSSDPNTLFLLEYMLTKNLELILTQGDDSREGVDLRWNYDY